MKIVFKILTLLVILIVMFYILYVEIIKKLFRNKDKISYNLFKKIIQVVSKNNNLMNYGIWYDDTETLKEANINLVNEIFEKTGLENKMNQKILDVGCGYGEQDIIWLKRLHETCEIDAIDISEEQIKYAQEKENKINYSVCNSEEIDIKFKNKLFNVIICLESAFHYNNRKLFLNKANKLLENDGRFVISDIMLKNDYNNHNFLTKLITKVYSDFLYMPKQNQITGKEWLEELESECRVIEVLDITENTFVPYYKHFMKTFVKNKQWVSCMEKYLIDLFCKNQPFLYKIAICEKKI